MGFQLWGFYWEPQTLSPKPVVQASNLQSVKTFLWHAAEKGGLKTRDGIRGTLGDFDPSNRVSFKGAISRFPKGLLFRGLPKTT